MSVVKSLFGPENCDTLIFPLFPRCSFLNQDAIFYIKVLGASSSFFAAFLNIFVNFLLARTLQKNGQKIPLYNIITSRLVVVVLTLQGVRVTFNLLHSSMPHQFVLFLSGFMIFTVELLLFHFYVKALDLFADEHFALPNRIRMTRNIFENKSKTIAVTFLINITIFSLMTTTFIFHEEDEQLFLMMIHAITDCLSFGWL